MYDALNLHQHELGGKTSIVRISRQHDIFALKRSSLIRMYYPPPSLILPCLPAERGRIIQGGMVLYVCDHVLSSSMSWECIMISLLSRIFSLSLYTLLFAIIGFFISMTFCLIIVACKRVCVFRFSTSHFFLNRILTSSINKKCFLSLFIVTSKWCLYKRSKWSRWWIYCIYV